MSLKDKAARIDFGSLPGDIGTQAGSGPAVVPTAELGTPVPRPKTAPGLMMAQAADQRSELLREAESLRAKVVELSTVAGQVTELQDELRAWDGAKATRLLDPKRVAWSQWANRDQSNFVGQDFDAFKAEISSAGGNVQPIKVRSLTAGSEFEYEIIFGHRRHRACLELGLPVLAVVDNVGEVDVFVQMDRENRSRKNLSAWEQGMMYLRALEKGLFPSSRKLADQVGADLGQVGKAIALARLPKEIIEAFVSPLDLQFRWAKPLTDASEADPTGMIARAHSAKALGPNRSAAAVLDLLLNVNIGRVGRADQVAPILIERDGKTLATIKLDGLGKATVSFASSVVSAGQMKLLGEMVENFLTKATKPKK